MIAEPGVNAAPADSPPGLLGTVRILDLAAPSQQLCGRLCAELGAEVIKVEPPDGDPARRLGPWARGSADPEGSLTFAALNSGKLSVALDPSSTDAREMLVALAQGSDAVLLSESSLWRDLVEPDMLVANGTPVVMLDGFSHDGPYAAFRSPETVTTALGGLLYISGDPTRPPCLPPEAIGEHFANVWAALATVAAVWATRTGRPAGVYRISTHEALATQEHLIRAAAMDGEPIVRAGSQHKSVAPATVFPTRDGFVYIYVSRNHWHAFLGVWDPHPAEFDDPSLLPNSARRAIAGTLNAAISEWTRQSTSHDLVARVQAAGVPCLAVNRPSDFVKDDQVVARGLFSPIRHPSLGEVLQIRFPALIDDHRPEPTRPPMLGEHTEIVLGGVTNRRAAP